MWVNKSVPAMAGARLVVSLNGLSLSPKYAPEMTAPATIAGLMPMVWPMPIRAIPTVAVVDQDEPVLRLIKAEMMTAVGKKNCTLIKSRP